MWKTLSNTSKVIGSIFGAIAVLLACIPYGLAMLFLYIEELLDERQKKS